MGNKPENDQPVAGSDEVGIFINAEGDYRVLLPHEWSVTGRVPEFAYLVVAALVRLARRDEVEFRSMLSTWAREDLTKSDELSLPNSRKIRKHGRPN